MRSWILPIVLAACVPPPPAAAPLPPVPPTPSLAPPATSLPSMSSSDAPSGPLPELASPAIPATAAAPRLPRGHLEHSMKNCPAAVAGATTRATNSEFGVELTITADDPANQRRIIELAAMHERMSDPDGSAMPHTGLHGGPGGLGRCPVIHTATIVTYTRIRKGVVVHVNAITHEDVERVQAIVGERVSYLAER
jgi:hypothetical protein